MQRKKKFNKKGDTSTSSRKKCTQVLLQKFQSLFFFFTSLLLKIYSQVLEIAYCSVTFILSLLPKPTSHVSREAATNRQLFGHYFPIIWAPSWASPALESGAEHQPISSKVLQVCSSLSVWATALRSMVLKLHSSKYFAGPGPGRV